MIVEATERSSDENAREKDYRNCFVYTLATVDGALLPHIDNEENH